MLASSAVVIELHTLMYQFDRPLGGVGRNDLPAVLQNYECSGFTKKLAYEIFRLIPS